MKIKHLIAILFFLPIGTKAFATVEYTTHICYTADTVTGRSYMPVEHIEYLKPEIFYREMPMDLEHKGEIIMEWFADYSSVFEYDSVKVENNDLSVFLKITELSAVECQELITSLLLNGCKNVTVVFSNGMKRTLSKKDINMPFFLPVYFYDDLSDDGFFIQNTLELLRIYETDSHCKELKTYGNASNRFSTVVYFLLGISVLLNVILFRKRKSIFRKDNEKQ